MNRVFACERNNLKGEAAYPILIEGAKICMDDMGISFDAENEESFFIERDENGKPYFVNLPIEFSISHTEGMWMCIMSDKPCGIDVQVHKKIDAEKIAERFYKPNEVEFVRVFQEAGFFQIWTRREAYGKMTGNGLWGDTPELVDDNISLVNKIEDYYLVDLDMGDGMSCALCVADKKVDSITFTYLV